MLVCLCVYTSLLKTNVLDEHPFANYFWSRWAAGSALAQTPDMDCDGRSNLLNVNSPEAVQITRCSVDTRYRSMRLLGFQVHGLIARLILGTGWRWAGDLSQYGAPVSISSTWVPEFSGKSCSPLNRCASHAGNGWVHQKESESDGPKVPCTEKMWSWVGWGGCTTRKLHVHM